MRLRLGKSLSFVLIAEFPQTKSPAGALQRGVRLGVILPTVVT